MNQPAPQAATKPPDKIGSKSIIVHPYSKIVFFYPTMLIALFAGIMLSMGVGSSSPESAVSWSRTLALIFLGTFSFNLLTVAFEFSRFSTIAIILFIFVLVLGALLINEHTQILPAIQATISKLQPEANAQFYYTIFGVFALIFLGVFVDSRFDYWEFRPNEILHKHGFLGDVKRYPAPGTHVSKEITDVLEYALLMSGTLVIVPPGVDRPIVLENVVRINAVEERLVKLLSTINVSIDSSRNKSANSGE